MSQTSHPSTPLTTTLRTQPPPTHHLHSSSDPLPGASESPAEAPPNYSADVTNDPRAWQDPGMLERERADVRAVVAGAQHHAGPDTDTEREAEAETGAGGKPKVTDKIVGKTQKVRLPSSPPPLLPSPRLFKLVERAGGALTPLACGRWRGR
ncbi:hypothetical protein ACG7TL_007475 [Trametes sanguinea]